MTKHPIYLIDDDAAVRDALALLFGAYDMRVEVYADAQSFLDTVAGKHPGYLLIDLQMPQISGPQLQEKLSRRGIAWPTIIITGNGDLHACRTAFRAGVVDFLTKPLDAEMLFDAISAAEKPLNTLLERLEAKAQLASLTAREMEILKLICGGSATKDIAVILEISNRTVDAHRAHICEKLGTTSVAELVQLTTLAEC